MIFLSAYPAELLLTVFFADHLDIFSRMAIPHSLAVVPERDLICVADRENARILCSSASDGHIQMEVKFPEFGTSVYAIAYSGKQLFVHIIQ